MDSIHQYRSFRHILCIDLKSFYAGVECVLRGLDPFRAPLVVADAGRGGGSIILAVTPYLKQRGVPSRCRIYELPKDLNIIFAKPRMRTYLEYSAKVVETYLEFVSIDDVFIYSVDEVFIDVSAYLSYYQMSAYELGRTILARLYEKLGLYATCGVGPNMLMAKLALDIDSKNAKDYIAQWDYDDLPERLWPVYPLSKMWGIGSRMEKHLNEMGMYKIGDIAHYDVGKLKARFGVLGEELFYHTHGIDASLVADKDKLRGNRKSFGVGQVLFKDYGPQEMMTIILEMVDDVTRRMRLAKRETQLVSLSIGYTKQYGGGFSRQVSLDQPTRHVNTIYMACLSLFDKYYEGLPMRTVSVSLGKLSDYGARQFSLFEDVDALNRDYELQLALDKIKKRFGKNAVNRLVSELDYATGKERNKQEGGHHV